MNKRYLLIALTISVIAPAFAKGQLYVCQDRTYKKIQDAVNAATPGATIHVCAGTYAEQVTIPVTVTDVKIVADGKAIVTEPTPAQPYGFRISGQNIQIQGFAITGFAHQTLSAGILVDHAAHVTIAGNVIYGNCNGVWMNAAADATITGNNISQNPYPAYPVAQPGIPEPPPGLTNSCDVLALDPVTGMALLATDGFGIKSIGGRRVGIANNNLGQNGECGIQVSGDSGGATISANSLFFNTGVNFTPCGNIDVRNVSGAANEVGVEGNRIDNGTNGVLLTQSDHISVENNNITRQFQGIQLVKSDRNTIKNNNAHANTIGIFMTGNFNLFNNNAVNHNDNQGIVVYLLGCPDPSVTTLGQVFDRSANNRFTENGIQHNGIVNGFPIDVLDFSILSGTQCPMDNNGTPSPTSTLDVWIGNTCDVSIPASICAH